MMDPLGFGFESFDAIGAWRARDLEGAIDASGSLPDGRSFAGPAELRTVLLERKARFARCLSEKLLTYALGRGLENHEQRTVSDIAQKLAANEFRFSSLVLAITHSTPFQTRGRRAQQ